jgi:uncharacterized protein YndB with AHSA1/START domain
MANLTANVSVNIRAPREKVWQALTDPAAIRHYMFGTSVDTDWQEGEPITWRGEWQGKPYEDKGEVLEVKPNARLAYSHFSSLSGNPDRPESYHKVVIQLTRDGDATRVSLSQDNNADENAKQHSEKNWGMMLGGLKQYLE